MRVSWKTALGSASSLPLADQYNLLGNKKDKPNAAAHSAYLFLKVFIQ